jgi:LysR family transcriptional activator of nhaA
MFLNYNHLYYFHVAAVEGSMAGAAQRLGVTQPTISEQLRTLELTLGATLFERLQSGLRLTEAGRLAFLHTTQMFLAGENLAVKTLPERGTATLRIGVSAYLPRSSVTELQLHLVARGEWFASTRTSDHVELLRALRTGQLDLVVCEVEPSLDMRRGLAVERIESTRLVVVAPPGVPTGHDWSEQGFVRFRATSPYFWAATNWLVARGRTPRIVAEADDALFLVDAAIHHRCITIVPESAAHEALAAGTLVLVESITSPDLAIYALYHDTTLARTAITRLVGTATHAQL